MKLNVDVINARINWAMTLQYPSWTLLLYSPPSLQLFHFIKLKMKEDSNWKSFFRMNSCQCFFVISLAQCWLLFQAQRKCHLLFTFLTPSARRRRAGKLRHLTISNGHDWSNVGAIHQRQKQIQPRKQHHHQEIKNKEKWWKPVEFGVWHSPLPTIRGPPAISSTFVFLPPVVFILEWVLSVGELGHR